MVYKIKLEGEKNYLSQIFTDAIAATSYAIDIFNGIPVLVFRKSKYHKYVLKIDDKNCYQLKVRCGIIAAGDNNQELDFFKKMFGNEKQGI